MKNSFLQPFTQNDSRNVLGHCVYYLYLEYCFLQYIPLKYIWLHSADDGVWKLINYVHSGHATDRGQSKHLLYTMT